MNSGKNVAVVAWMDPEGKQRSLDVSPGSVEDEAIFSATEAPTSVEITATDKETNKQVTVNNVNKLQVTPLEVDEMITINIGQGICYYTRNLSYYLTKVEYILNVSCYF